MVAVFLLFVGFAAGALVVLLSVIVFAVEAQLQNPPGHGERSTGVGATGLPDRQDRPGAPEVAEAALMERCQREVLLAELERVDGCLRWLTDVRRYRAKARLQ